MELNAKSIVEINLSCEPLNFGRLKNKSINLLLVLSLDNEVIRDYFNKIRNKKIARCIFKLELPTFIDVKTLPSFKAYVICLKKLNSKQLACGSEDLRIWCLQTGSFFNLIGHKNDVVCLLQLKSNELISGGQDKLIKIWNFLTKTCLNTLIGHEGEISCVIKLDENQIVSSSEDKKLKLWDTKSGNCIKTFGGNFGKSLLKLNLDQFISVGVDKNNDDPPIMILEVQTEKCLDRLVDHELDILFLLRLSYKEIASGSIDQSIKIWDLQNRNCLRTLSEHDSFITCLLKLDSIKLASGSFDNTIKIWNYKTGICLKTINVHSEINCMVKLNLWQFAFGTDCFIGIYEI